MPLSAPRPSLSFRAVNRAGEPGHNPGLQRHHLLPLQVLSVRPLGKVIERLGLERLGMHDFRRNGLLLPAREDAARRIGLPSTAARTAATTSWCWNAAARSRRGGAGRGCAVRTAPTSRR